MEKLTTFSPPFLQSSLPTDKKIFRLRIYFRVKKTDIDNQCDIYSKTCAYGSSMIEVVYFNVSYAPVAGIHPLCITISIESVEGLIIFDFDISNGFQETLLHNLAEILYLILTHIYIYLECFKINFQNIH